MCGPHEEYLTLFHHHFSIINNLLQKNKKIFFLEGNHDVHLEGLFHKMWKKNEIIISQNPLIEQIDGKNYYFSHGDEHEVDNLNYQRYIRFIRSRPLRFIANHLMPYGLLSYLGERASKQSRKKGSLRFDSEDVRTRFRVGVAKSTNGLFDFVIGGHSHVKDEFIIPGSNSIYINNGYALHSKTFILIENHQSKFISIDNSSQA
jgi:UDP-2,3-diacylglucosamine hydrolase